MLSGKGISALGCRLSCSCKLSPGEGTVCPANGLGEVLPAALRTCRAWPGALGERREEGISLPLYLLIPFIIMGSSHSVFTPIPQHCHLDVLKTSQNHESQFQHDLPHSTPPPKKTKTTFPLHRPPPLLPPDPSPLGFSSQPPKLRFLSPPFQPWQPRCHQIML